MRLSKTTLIGLIILIDHAYGCQTNQTNFIPGIYINQNYSYSPKLVEVPYVADTLILNANFTFRSGYFGEGTYTVTNNTLILDYKYEFGEARFEAPIEIVNDGDVRIILFREMDHYYQKIK